MTGKNQLITRRRQAGGREGGWGGRGGGECGENVEETRHDNAITIARRPLFCIELSHFRPSQKISMLIDFHVMAYRSVLTV